MVLPVAFRASLVTAAVVPDRSQIHPSQSSPQVQSYNPCGNLEGPGRSPIWDEYASSLYSNNTVESQQTLMTVFVNRAMAGRSRAPDVGINVNGVIWPDDYHDVPGDLIGFLNGALNSTNTGAGHGVPVKLVGWWWC